MKALFELVVGTFLFFSSVFKVAEGQLIKKDTVNPGISNRDTSLKERQLLQRAEKVLTGFDSLASKLESGIEVKDKIIDKLDEGRAAQVNSLRLLAKLKRVDHTPVKFLKMKMRTIEPVSYIISDTVSLPLPEIKTPCENKRPWLKRIFNWKR